MKIKKIGHCCLLIKTENITILTDPGEYTTEQNLIKDIDVVLITHEHADHLHIDSLKEIIKNNPEVKILTNSGVGKILEEKKIPFEKLEGKATINIKNTLLEAFDHKHEEIFQEVGQVQNTGYFIDNKLFYPGDAFCDPGKKVEILALPVAGPWCKTPDAIKYALKIAPKVAFPIHDAMLQKDRIGGYHRIPARILTENNILFIILEEGKEKDF